MSDDLISREALKKAIEEQRKSKVYSEADERQNVIIDCILYIIDNAQTVEINQSAIWWNGYYTGKILGEHKKTTGEWIEVNIKPTPYGGYTCNHKCNRCDYVTKEYRLNYCPNCGAEMEEADNE